MEKIRAMTTMFFFFCILFSNAPAWSHTPLGGLAVAVSPGGKTIVTGGDNRVLYVLDPSTLRVKKRIWTESGIWRMAFNKNGEKLLVEDTTPTIRYFKTSDWKLERELKREGFMSTAPLVDTMAALDSGSKSVSVFSMTDGSIKKTVKTDVSISAFGIDPNAKRLAVISRYEKDKSEEKVAFKDIPKDLKGAAKKAFIQKNDGKTSVFFLYEIPSGKLLFKKKIFFSATNGSKLVFNKDSVLVICYNNVNAKIDTKTGNTAIFELGNSFNYGIGLSTDQKRIASGGLANGTYTMVDENVQKKFKITKIKGWPEYFKDFAFDSMGNLFGTTSGYRIITVNESGKVIKSVPVY